jgi:hypothetical protein
MGLFNVFIAYKFIKLLVKPYKDTDAYKLGLIDDKGLALKKKSDFTDSEKKAYNATHELVWNIKRLLNKIPGLKSRLGSFAVALWMLKQKMSPQYQAEEVQCVENAIIDHIEKEFDCDMGSLIVESILLDEIPSTGLYQLTEESYCEIFKEVQTGDIFSCLDNVSVGEGCGIEIYEMVHLSSGNKYPVTTSIMLPYSLKEEEMHEISIQA